ncbi:MAG: hypothetical protein Q8L39_13160 [Burkholderiales bacterium]|nr:hypothetical protein [Burkholderiales bacterium]
MVVPEKLGELLPIPASGKPVAILCLSKVEGWGERQVLVELVFENGWGDRLLNK